MKKLLIILLAFTAFSCQDDIVIDKSIASYSVVGEWLLTDFTINGEVPELNQINEGIMILREDGTGTGLAPIEFLWWVEDDRFYLEDRFGGVRVFDIVILTDVNFVFTITYDNRVIDNNSVPDQTLIFEFTRK